MDPESEKLLEETKALTEENNRILRKVRGFQKKQVLWSTIKIIFVIGVALGAFYFLEPYISKLMSLYSSITGTQQKLDGGSVQNLLKNL